MSNPDPKHDDAYIADHFDELAEEWFEEQIGSDDGRFGLFVEESFWKTVDAFNYKAQQDKLTEFLNLTMGQVVQRFIQIHEAEIVQWAAERLAAPPED